MASNLLQNGHKIQWYFAEALMEDHLSGSLGERLFKTPDLNLPPFDMGNHIINLKNRVDGEIKASCCVMKDTKKRCMIWGLDINSNGEDSNTCFILKLTPTKKEESVNGSSMSSSSPPLHPHMFVKQKDLNETLAGGFDTLEEVPSLVCMGCKHCYMYIMVSESAPKCPNCKSIDLIDFSCFNLNHPMKKARKN
ncbi:hypothetical protein U1Q18_014980 [Sarracenia purpurea var. burkii]